MGISKIQIEIVKELLEKYLKAHALFLSYTFIKYEIQNLSAPTKITNYDFTFTSEPFNRWLFIRLQDFYKHQKLILWINQIKDKKNTNIDVNNYFIWKQKNNSFKGKLIFKADTVEDLEIAIRNIFEYLEKHSDKNLKKIFMGEIWLEMPVDWGGYK